MDNSTKIRKVSKAMQYISFGTVLLMIAMQLTFSLLMRLQPEQVLKVVDSKDIVTFIYQASPLYAIPAWLIYLLPSLLLGYGIWRLGLMFRLFSRGAYFSDECVNHLLVFSLMGFVAQFFNPLFRAAAGLVAQLGNEHGQINLSVGVNGFSAAQLIAWVTFMIVAWILREGIRLARENAEFI